MNWYKTAKSHKYSCVMLPLGWDVAQSMLSFGREIPDDDLAEKGRQEHPHVTVLYGLHTNDMSEVVDVLHGEKEVTLTMGKTKVFPADEERNSDVVVLEVKSDDLHRLHKKLKKLEHTDTYREYKPHATIAYVKPGKGKKYEGKVVCSDTIKRDLFEFSNKVGNITEFSLGSIK